MEPYETLELVTPLLWLTLRQHQPRLLRNEDSNYLWFTPFGEPKRLITRGGAGSGAAAERMSRIPPGHPEGYLEGFANIYSEAAKAILARRTGGAADPAVTYPTVLDGLKGVSLVDACVRSSQRNAAWVKL